MYKKFFLLRLFKIYSLSNCKMCNTVLVNIVAMLYVTPPWRIYFITGSSYVLTPFTHFAHSITPTPNIWQPPIYSLFLWALGFFAFLVSDSTCKWDHMAFVCVWHISLNHEAFRVHPCCHKWQDFIFFMTE